MNDADKSACKIDAEREITLFVKAVIENFRNKTGCKVQSIFIPSIAVTDMNTVGREFTIGSCQIELVEEQKYSPISSNDATYWVCCGGIHLELDESCPVCGDSYE